jgi:BAR domain
MLFSVCFYRRAFQLCGEAEGTIAVKTVEMEIDIENKVLLPLNSLLEVDLPSIQKLRKQLTSRTLDMDAAKTR